MLSHRRLNRPAPVLFRPLISGPIHQPRCRRSDLDRPLGPNVERIRRAINDARFMQAWESGDRDQYLIAVLPLVVDEWIDSLTSTIPTAEEAPPPSLGHPPGWGDAD